MIKLDDGTYAMTLHELKIEINRIYSSKTMDFPVFSTVLMGSSIREIQIVKGLNRNEDKPYVRLG